MLAMLEMNWRIAINTSVNAQIHAEVPILTQGDDIVNVHVF